MGGEITAMRRRYMKSELGEIMLRCCWNNFLKILVFY